MSRKKDRAWWAYNYNQEKDVLRLQVKPVWTNKIQEELLYEVKDNLIQLSWGKLQLPIIVGVQRCYRLSMTFSINSFCTLFWTCLEFLSKTLFFKDGNIFEALVIIFSPGKRMSFSAANKVIGVFNK